MDCKIIIYDAVLLIFSDSHFLKVFPWFISRL